MGKLITEFNILPNAFNTINLSNYNLDTGVYLLKAQNGQIIKIIKN